MTFEDLLKRADETEWQDKFDGTFVLDLGEYRITSYRHASGPVTEWVTYAEKFPPVPGQRYVAHVQLRADFPGAREEAQSRALFSLGVYVLRAERPGQPVPERSYVVRYCKACGSRNARSESALFEVCTSCGKDFDEQWPNEALQRLLASDPLTPETVQAAIDAGVGREDVREHVLKVLSGAGFGVEDGRLCAMLAHRFKMSGEV